MSARIFTLEELNRLLGTCLDAEERMQVRPEHLDVEFDALGVDSLGLYEVASLAEREHGLRLPDGAVECRTPRELLDHLERALRPVLVG